MAHHPFVVLLEHQSTDHADDGADVEFKFRGDGKGTCDGSWTGGGADYAEYFE